MNIEAILVIGGLSIVLGIVLLIPGLWWARNKAKKDVKYRKKVNFTFVGWIHLLIMLSFLLGGVMMPYFAPDTYIAQITSSSFGRSIWALLTILLFACFAKILNAFGLLLEKQEKGDKSV